MPCSLVDKHICFERMCGLHFQGGKFTVVTALRALTPTHAGLPKAGSGSGEKISGPSKKGGPAKNLSTKWTVAE